jgi:hypothetical protein
MYRIAFPALILSVVLVAAATPGISDDSSTDRAPVDPAPVDKGAVDVTPGELAPLDVFNQRIMPIFRSAQPSSCVQCHLSAVDLKNYILPSHDKTFVSLRDQGLIDLDQPNKSKILGLIRMGEKDLDQGARLIHEKMRQAEYDAFATWIGACCEDPRLRNLPPLASIEQARPAVPDAVIRHARKSRLVDSFARNIWSQRLRCSPCHTPHEIDESNPRQQAAIKKLREMEAKYSPELVARLKIFKETPEATMQYLIDASRSTAAGELPLINLENPRQSLIVLKPLSKLPTKLADGTFAKSSSSLPVSHMGGLKMHPNDQSYKSFVAWLQDYSNVVGNRYASVDELPTDNWHASQLALRVKPAPAAWQVGVPVQLFVHGWLEDAQRWNPNPVAFTQGTVNPRHAVNGLLFLFASNDSDSPHELAGENNSLPKGRYLIRCYTDTQSRLEEDPTRLLGPDDFAGEVELKKPRWRPGFRRAEVVSGEKLSTAD